MHEHGAAAASDGDLELSLDLVDHHFTCDPSVYLILLEHLHHGRPVLRPPYLHWLLASDDHLHKPELSEVVTNRLVAVLHLESHALYHTQRGGSLERIIGSGFFLSVFDDFKHRDLPFQLIQAGVTHILGRSCLVLIRHAEKELDLMVASQQYLQTR